MSRITRRRTILIAQETTFGTAATLSATNALAVFNPLLQFDTQVDDREPSGTLGPIASVPGPQGAKVSFSTELASGLAGAAEPAYAALLFAACGLKGTSHVYRPSSNPADFKTLTIAVVEAGPSGATAKLASGCMGTFSIEGENGKRGMINWDFTGCWLPSADQSFPTLPALPANPARFAGVAFTVGAYTPNFQRFRFDYGGTVTRVPAINTTSGYAYGLLVNRRSRGNFDADADTVANFNVYGQQTAMTQSAFSMAIPTPSGGTITLAAPYFQIVNATEGDRSGLTTEQIDFQFNQVAGDDDFSITFA